MRAGVGARNLVPLLAALHLDLITAALNTPSLVVKTTTSQKIIAATATRSPPAFVFTARPIQTRQVCNRNSLFHLSVLSSSSSSSSSLFLLPTQGSQVRLISTTLAAQMPRGVKKEYLPTKVCVTCGRPFTWRKKWERCWEEVTTCSKSCNQKRRSAKQQQQQQLKPKENGKHDPSSGDDDTGSNGSSGSHRSGKGKSPKSSKGTASSASQQRASTTTNTPFCEQKQLSVFDFTPLESATATMQQHDIIAAENDEHYFIPHGKHCKGPLGSNQRSLQSTPLLATMLQHHHIKEEQSSLFHHDNNMGEESDSLSFASQISPDLDDCVFNNEDGFVAWDQDHPPTIPTTTTTQDDTKAQRKAAKKLLKAQRRAQRQGRGDSTAGQKLCDLCGQSVNLLIRCLHQKGQIKWSMVCGQCWHGVSGGVVDGDAEHPHYRYGGLWKNRRAQQQQQQQQQQQSFTPKSPAPSSQHQQVQERIPHPA